MGLFFCLLKNKFYMKFILIILFVFLSSSTPVNAAEPCHEDIKMVIKTLSNKKSLCMRLYF